MSLRYAGLLHGNINADITSSSGIFEGEDVIKLLLAGTDTVQVVSTLYKNKIDHTSKMLSAITNWMDEKGYDTINDFKGKLARKNTNDPFVYLRAQYVDALLNKSENIIKSFPAL